MAGMKERRATIFQNEGSRAVRIPADFDLDASEVVLRQTDGGAITISPLPKTPARKLTLAEALDEFAKLPPLGSEDRFPDIDDPLPEPVVIDWPDGK